jgi:hypothetical protein
MTKSCAMARSALPNPELWPTAQKLAHIFTVGLNFAQWPIAYNQIRRTGP